MLCCHCQTSVHNVLLHLYFQCRRTLERNVRSLYQRIRVVQGQVGLPLMAVLWHLLCTQEKHSHMVPQIYDIRKKSGLKDFLICRISWKAKARWNHTSIHLFASIVGDRCFQISYVCPRIYSC
ncbi:hypothetical protein Hanom_Chr06g00573661 [Helianthus anomalus]